MTLYALVAAWNDTNAKQPGDPAKLAQALVTIVDEQPPIRRFIAGGRLDRLHPAEGRRAPGGHRHQP
jgi:hypothetical protein